MSAQPSTTPTSEPKGKEMEEAPEEPATQVWNPMQTFEFTPQEFEEHMEPCYDCGEPTPCVCANCDRYTCESCGYPVGDMSQFCQGDFAELCRLMSCPVRRLFFNAKRAR